MPVGFPDDSGSFHCYYKSNGGVIMGGRNEFYVFAVLILTGCTALAAGISGVVVDALTGMPIHHAAVTMNPGDERTITDDNGSFRFRSVIPGRYVLEVTAAGYTSVIMKHIDIRKGMTQDRSYRIELNPFVYETEITVTAESRELRFKDVMVTQLPAELLEDAPGGLDDTVRKVQTLPGVTIENDFSAVMYVRGGSSDETMLFLDHGYLLNPYHLGGAFTVYFEDLVDSVEFYTGGFPARYGNALSGILDVQYRSGNRRENAFLAEAGLISSKFRAEGPIIKDKLCFLVAGRRTYWEHLIDMVGDDDDDIAAPYFGDVLGKISFFDSHRTVSLEMLYGEDGIKRFELDEPMEHPDADPGTFYYLNTLRLGNLTWEEWVNPRLHVNAGLSYTRSSSTADLTGTEPIFADAIIDFMMVDFQTAYERLRTRFSGGVQAGWADITLDSFLTDYRYSIPGARKTGNENIPKTDVDFNQKFRFQSLWSEFEYAPGGPRSVQMSLGCRMDRWGSSGDVTWSPRFNMTAGLTKHWRVRAAAGLFCQFPYDVLQTAPNFGNEDLESERAMHYITGLEGDLSSVLKLRVEMFYKDYDKLIVNHDTLEAAEAAAVSGKSFVNEGSGYASGFEVFCQLFPWRTLDGWLTYSYGVSRRYNPLHLENSKWYYPLQDQRHSAHLIANYRPFKNWTFSARVSYGSGKPETAVNDWELERDNDPPYYPIWVATYGELNADRLESYFRLDLKARWRHVFPDSELTAALELINATNQKNIYTYGYDSGDPPRHKPDKENVYNLPFLPVLSVTYTF